MKSRLDRYSENEQTKAIPSRLAKNKHLYDDLNNKIGFEELTNFDTQTRIDLTSLNGVKRNRESYQQLKDYHNLMSNNFENDKPEIEIEEEKVFDINSILEEARKNRTEIDEMEKKRKLKDEEYNVLGVLNKKYLSKEIEEKDKNKDKDEYEGLEELINTITSKTLVNDIKIEESKDDDLLAELVATSVDLQVNIPETYENTDIREIAVKIEEENNEQDEEEIDNSFYTKSMDLSEHDFDFDELTEKKSSIKKGILITLVTIILLIIIGVVIFFVLQNAGLNIFDIFK